MFTTIHNFTFKRVIAVSVKRLYGMPSVRRGPCACMHSGSQESGRSVGRSLNKFSKYESHRDLRRKTRGFSLLIPLKPEHARSWTIPGGMILRRHACGSNRTCTTRLPHGIRGSQRRPTEDRPTLLTSLLLFCAVFVEAVLGLLIGSLTRIHATPHLDLLVGK